MDGFKANAKMRSDLPCYKTGGIVKRAKGGMVKHDDVKQDKALIKKELKSAKVVPGKKTGGVVTGDKGKGGSSAAKKEVGAWDKGGKVKKERSMKKNSGINDNDMGKPGGSKLAAKPAGGSKKAATPAAPDAQPFGMDQPVQGGMGGAGIGAAPPPAPGLGGIGGGMGGGAPAFNHGGGVHYHSHTYNMGGPVSGYDMGGMVTPGGGSPMGAPPPAPGGMGGAPSPAPGGMGGAPGGDAQTANLMALKKKLAMLAQQQGGGVPPQGAAGPAQGMGAAPQGGMPSAGGAPGLGG